MRSLLICLITTLTVQIASAQSNYLNWSKPSSAQDTITGIACSSKSDQGLHFSFLNDNKLVVVFERIHQSVIGTRRKLSEFDTRPVTLNFINRNRSIGRLKGDITVHSAKLFNGQVYYDMYLSIGRKSHINLFRRASYVEVGFSNGLTHTFLLNGSSNALKAIDKCRAFKPPQWTMVRSQTDWHGSEESGEGAPIPVCVLRGNSIEFGLYTKYAAYHQGGEVRLSGRGILDDRDHTLFVDNRFRIYFNAEPFAEEGIANVGAYKESFFREMARGSSINLIHGTGSNAIDIKEATNATTAFMNCAKEKLADWRALTRDWRLDGPIAQNGGQVCYAVHTGGFRIEKYKYWPEPGGISIATSDLLLLPVRRIDYRRLAQRIPESSFDRLNMEQANFDFDVDPTVGINLQFMGDKNWQTSWLDAKGNRYRKEHSYLALMASSKIMQLIGKNNRLNLIGIAKNDKSRLDLSPTISQFDEIDVKLHECLADAQMPSNSSIKNNNTVKSKPVDVDRLVDHYFALIASENDSPEIVKKRCNLAERFINDHTEIVNGDMRELIEAQKKNDGCPTG